MLSKTPFTSLLPQHPKTIFIIGAGGIVNDAHLPAYKLAGFTVGGIFDLDYAKAAKTAQNFSIPRVFESLEQLLSQAPKDVVFDLALPGSALIPVLRQLPNESIGFDAKANGKQFERSKGDCNYLPE